MKTYTKEELKEILELHKLWIEGSSEGKRADLSFANLRYANLRSADLSSADLSFADLSFVDLSFANLRSANLRSADLRYANLRSADLRSANLRSADLSFAELLNTKGLIKLIGVEHGNYYWKKISSNLENNGYNFKLGLNKLKEGEIFASDERVLCSYPGFHFASKSWCNLNYPERRYLCKIKIPEEAEINEPWASDGKASASMIEIIQIFDNKDGKMEDVTEQFRNKE